MELNPEVGDREAFVGDNLVASRGEGHQQGLRAWDFNDFVTEVCIRTVHECIVHLREIPISLGGPSGTSAMSSPWGNGPDLITIDVKVVGLMIARVTKPVPPLDLAGGYSTWDAKGLRK